MIATQTLAESKEHLCFHGEYEYIRHLKHVYRARLADPIDPVTGYRPNWWFCTWTAWEPFCQRVGIESRLPIASRLIAVTTAVEADRLARALTKKFAEGGTVQFNALQEGRYYIVEAEGMSLDPRPYQLFADGWQMHRNLMV